MGEPEFYSHTPLHLLKQTKSKLKANCCKICWDKNQGWEFAHLLIAHLLICSFHSNKMSKCERFAQIAQDKGATLSESLRSL